jgi:hypothetical protein
MQVYHDSKPTEAKSVRRLKGFFSVDFFFGYLCVQNN